MQTPRDVWQEIKDDADLATTKLMFEVEHSDVKWRVEDGQRLNGKYRAENAFGPYTRWELGLSSSLSSPLMTTPHKRAASKEISEEPAKILKAENHHFTCIVCLDNYDLEQGVHAPCGEFYCDEDLTELFRNAMTEAPIHLPRCCGQVVPYEMVGDHLEVNLAEAFYQKMEELGDRRRVYCHKCSTYISEKNRNAILATCSICRAGTCVLCHRATHAGPCIIGKGAEGFLQLAKAKGWQICYSCETMVERDDGCNHMTCFCDAHFCHVCGTPWLNCGCRKDDEVRLLNVSQKKLARNKLKDVNKLVQPVAISVAATSQNTPSAVSVVGCDSVRSV